MADDAGIERLTQELIAIKRLLVCALLQNGTSQAVIASALGVNQSSISRMLGKGGVPKRSPGPRPGRNVGEDDA